MKAYIRRNEEQFGPYPVEDIRKYVHDGNVVETDLCRAPESQDWITVSSWLIRFPSNPATQPPVPFSNSNGAAPAAALPQNATLLVSGPAVPGFCISHQGQEYGPWSREEVQRYLTEGRLSLSDFARTGPNQPWAPLPTILAASGVAPGALIPPSLHWLLLILIQFFTGCLFGLVWIFVQTSWMKKINPKSRATGSIAVATLGGLAGVALLTTGGIAEGLNPAPSGAFDINMVMAGLGLLLLIAAPIFFFSGIFSMKKSLETYYNTIEPINLRLSSFMVIFFNIYYFQYHFTRIAEWKRGGSLSS